jgi:hypothetical protein
MALAAVVAFAIGCGGDKGKPAVTPDAGTPDGSSVKPDGGMSPDATTAAVKLFDWVDDLVTHHTNFTSPPDTVDDKNILDTDNPNEFDTILK